MEKAGVRSDLHIYKGQKHGFFNKARYKETLQEADEFLVSLGYLKKTEHRKAGFWGLIFIQKISYRISSNLVQIYKNSLGSILITSALLRPLDMTNANYRWKTWICEGRSG